MHPSHTTLGFVGFTLFVTTSFATASFISSANSDAEPISHAKATVQKHAGRAEPTTFAWKQIAPSTDLKWHDCYSELQCARLSVPLNYSDPGGAIAAIAIIRKPSSLPVNSSQYQGPLLLNPGGPGGSGVEYVKFNGAPIASIVGPQFDIVGFDPRGIGRSTPRASFFEDPVERALWDSDTVGLRVVNATADGVAREWARSQVTNQLAAERQLDVLRHINTEHTARDMLKIIEAHGRKKLQYWGFSYGTLLGATFAAMFPDKIERMILDGVVDAEEWYQGVSFNLLLDTDKTMQYFFDGCHAAGPSGCAFYAPSPSEIANKLAALYDSIRLRPIPVKGTTSYGLVDYSRLRTTILGMLYRPFVAFVPLAQALADLAAGNGTLLLELFPSPKLQCNCNANESEDFDFVAGNDARTTVLCNDSDRVPLELEAFQDYFKELTARSSWGDIAAVLRASCIGWPDIPKNQFRGPIEGNTTFPIMLIGNTADPITPLWGAKKMSHSFPGSVVLTQDSPGHASTSAPSLCTAKYIRQYLVDGVLPPPDTTCAVEGSVFKQAALSRRGVRAVPEGRGEARSAVVGGDREVLDALEALSATWGHQSMWF